MKQAEHNEKTLPRGFGHAPTGNPFDHVPANKGNKCLRKTNEANTERTLIDDTTYGVIGL